MNSIVTGDDVLVMYVHERNKQRAYHGLAPVSPEAFATRGRALWGPVCAKAAGVCNLYSIDPVMWVEACFRYARSMRHPDGPMPNCLGSETYGMKALAYVLNIPVDAVRQKCSLPELIKGREDAYCTNFAYIRKTLGARMWNTLDIYSLTSIPAADRLLAVALRPDVCALMLEQVKEELMNDRTTCAWFANRGWTIEKLEEHAKKI